MNVTFDVIEARIGYALVVGTFNIPSSVGDLTGTTAFFLVGELSEDASKRRLEIHSSDNIIPPVVFDYNTESRTVDVKLSQEQIQEIGPGEFYFELGLLKNGQRLFGGIGNFIVRKSV